MVVHQEFSRQSEKRVELKEKQKMKGKKAEEKRRKEEKELLAEYVCHDCEMRE